ncbi:Uncharacterised protein [Mycobacteroides abscessus]|nr:Uncharacterised protein [Mycobacteroides abscessus]SHV24356.1 Uncharacterised protein [Mycobacteroides abscessus subsp. abscessus]
MPASSNASLDLKWWYNPPEPGVRPAAFSICATLVALYPCSPKSLMASVTRRSFVEISPIDASKVIT